MKKILSILIIILFSLNAKGQFIDKLGVELGQSSIIGDIEALPFKGYSFEIYVQSRITKFLNYEPSLYYSKTFGLSHELFSADGFSLVNWFPAYRNTNYIAFQKLSSTLEIAQGKIKFEPQLGIGLGTSSTWMNMLDNSGNPYRDIEIVSGFNLNDENYLSNIEDIYDDTYETRSFDRKGIFSVGENGFNVYYTAALRIIYDISDEISVGLNHAYVLTDFDYLDGVSFRNEEKPNNKSDKIQSIRMVLKFRI